jgi:hypothetical protein
MSKDKDLDHPIVSRGKSNDFSPEHSELLSQKKLYERITSDYSYGPGPKQRDGAILGLDYYYMGTIKGVEYYTPNDEDWMFIIALDHKNKLAADTGFLEMDDFEHQDSDYVFVCHNGELMCEFQTH